MPADKQVAFTYRPLKPGEIRLLAVESSADKGTVWSLNHVQLSKEEGDELPGIVEFDALSYTWGDLEDTFPLTLACGRTIQIHHNLHIALPYLARRHSTKPVWIDAVCINQSDGEEKRSQIKLMNKLYSSASKVWVWLGPSNVHTAKAIALLPLIAQIGQECQGLDPAMLNETPESKGLPELSSPIWPAVYDIMSNRWFTRLWTVQEAALAKSLTFLHGDYELEWNVLEQAMDSAQHVNALHDANRKRTQFEGAQSIFPIRDIAQARLKVISESKTSSSAAAHLLRVILLAQKHKCFDPRDRVFGVLGFVEDREVYEAGLYDPSLSLTELYTRFSRFLLLNVGVEWKNFWLLLNHATAPGKMEGLPSWCPDWHNTELYDSLTQRKVRLNSGSAGIQGKEMAQQDADPNTLVLRGAILDSLSNVYPEIPCNAREMMTPSVQELIKHLAEFEAWEREIAFDIFGTAANTEIVDKLYLSSQDGQEGSISYDEYVNAMLGTETTWTGTTLNTSSLYQFRDGVRKFVSFLRQCEALYEKSGLEALEAADAAGLLHTEASQDALAVMHRGSPAIKFFFVAIYQQGNGRLFRTQGDRMGLGWAQVREGDLLVVFDGARTPYIIRPLGGRKDKTYTLVGQAAINSITSGEVNRLDTQRQDITLI